LQQTASLHSYKRLNQFQSGVIF